MQTDSVLRQAVEQQLDLILKIEEERKLLKKENKMLKEEHQKMLATIKQYACEKVEQAVNTQEQACEEKKEEKAILLDQYVQVDLDVGQTNTSKLSSAQELLKQLNISSQNLCSRCEEQLQNTTNYSYQPSKQVKKTAGNQQVSNEIVKLAKEIAGLKRQLKDCDAKYKQKEKELKQVKKCLDTKSQALEKSRKEFNELSQVFNGDKYKSVRALENQNKQLKTKNTVLEEQARTSTQLKTALLQLTNQYEEYREDRESRISRLIAQLKQKDSKCDELTRQLERSYSLS